MYLLQPGVGRAGRLHAADRVQHHDAVVLQQLLHLAEVLDVVGDADMLEHADRDDAVVAVGLLAIVEQLEAHPVGEAALQRAAARDVVLLLRQGDAGHVDAVLLAEEQAHAAPARADVEHLLAGHQQHLRGDVLLLVELGLLERLVAVLEVGAGILPVAVEEEIVELAVEVVVVRHVALRLADRIVLFDPADRPLPEIGPADERRGVDRRHVAAQEIEQVVDVAVLDRQLAVHVGFAEGEAGMKNQPDARPPCMYPHGDRRALFGPLDAMRLARRIDNGQLSFP